MGLILPVVFLGLMASLSPATIVVSSWSSGRRGLA